MNMAGQTTEMQNADIGSGLPRSFIWRFSCSIHVSYPLGYRYPRYTNIKMSPTVTVKNPEVTSNGISVTNLVQIRKNISPYNINGFHFRK